ncbi:Protein of unknown function (DUF4245) [Streptoalloteichus tenebrarius]|uniref:DUF4245 domain-containing protein n=1 Tax=Streptoalloteichus tenebrarius (strain ATCC 17920 / DSM 40477 / JCM 4838 / CBS 697.72 / NBRC 16177 / NCIMB 11028 / NRRL B-12390 / A12253. 1 / ISP 5477) TaxID=1933 RepID=A0ABT1HTV7_STRSD|nr:DUF4245 domain-containing protein [Streptoalloteichus tenebrarius]MCP2258923.1 Protein of unknown function (DUF4245) [Streptoalloteichus tenebrarius]BFF01130.1 hypothetical protein GCM10020241_28050 [Streptoalloteichus tenebrarius]
MSATPSSPPPRSRAQHGVRDIVLSLVFLLLIVLAIVGVTRGCSFSPGGPSVDPNAVRPTVDAPAELRRAAGRVPFAVRVPAVPEGWHGNSSGVDRVGDTTPKPYAVRVGWLTDQGHYVRLSQSDAAEPDLLRFETGHADAKATGSVEVDGVRWTVYPGQRDERAWTTTLDGHQVLITGSGSEAEFRALASATQAAPLAPSSSRPAPPSR